MNWIQTLFENLPTTWALLALIAVIGLSVVLLRGIIKLAVKAFIIGLVGLVVLGFVYFLI